MAMGATLTLTRQLAGKGNGAWWLTAIGEVPIQTLQSFAQSLERRR
jgi:sigma-E factor negative regulatory protein RseB